MDDKIGMEPVKVFEKIVEEINEMQIQTQMRKSSLLELKISQSFLQRIFIM